MAGALFSSVFMEFVAIAAGRSGNEVEKQATLKRDVTADCCKPSFVLIAIVDESEERVRDIEGPGWYRNTAMDGLSRPIVPIPRPKLLTLGSSNESAHKRKVVAGRHQIAARKSFLTKIPPVIQGKGVQRSCHKLAQLIHVV